jgi:ABC-type transporter Mla subunit MlaD
MSAAEQPVNSCNKIRHDCKFAAAVNQARTEETPMRRCVPLFLAVAFSCLAIAPAYAASKEMIELQQQMDTLLKQQQTIAESMGQLKDRMDKVVQQTTENMNRISATVDKMDKNMQLQTAGADSCADQVAGQVQPLHDALSELKANVDAINKQLATLNDERQPEPSAQGTKPATTPNQPQ